MKDYYGILEVNEKASQEIIEKAYKTLVKKYHPDLYSSIEKREAEKKLKEIHQDKLKKLNEYDSYINIKNCQDEIFYSLNNFEAFVLQALNVLHLENTMILGCLNTDKQSAASTIKMKMYDKMFYDNIKNDLYKFL